MEPISTFNFGASLAQQSKSIPLKNLASKARQLVRTQNQLEGNQANGTQSLNMGQESSATHTNKDKELMDVARKFEALLIHQMLKAMRQTVHKSDLLNSFSMQQYESMMDEEIANEMAKNKGIGLADSLFYQLSRLEKAANLPPTSSNKFLGVKQYE
jgi:Rod binding domain-containing protein